MPSRPLTKAQIEANIEYDERGCWNWKGPYTNQGYGYHSQYSNLVHKASFKLWIGEYTPGWQLDHRCNNKKCCCPSHLVPAPRGLNTQLAYIEKHKQMPWKSLRVARHLHNEVGEPSAYARSHDGNT